MKLITTTACILAASTLSIVAQQQIGDFRIGSGDFSTETAFDAGFGDLHGETTLTTRATVGAPVNVNSNFTGTTQTAGGSPDLTTDITLRTYSSVTRIEQLNRATSSDGSVPRSGAVQWNFDLTPLDSYLSTNSFQLDTLTLDLETATGGGSFAYDVYLSYTDTGIDLTGISTDPTTNYSTFWDAAADAGATAGAIVNSDFKVLAIGQEGALSLSESLLALYNGGVKEFNLIMTSGVYGSGRQVDIAAGSGLFIETSPIPEPSSYAAILGLSALALIVRRRR